MPPPYPLSTLHTVAARSGVAIPLKSRQTIRILNTHGTQVVDFWAFSSSTLAHRLSLSHTRTSTLHLSPLISDVLITNRREPILCLIADTTPGIHDTLIAACDLPRYRQLTKNPTDTAPHYYHANCNDNLFSALRSLDIMPSVDFTPPDPLNLFMNIPVLPRRGAVGADLEFETPTSEAGQSVTFKALMDCVVVMSACPQDLVKVNAMTPREVHFIIENEEET